MSDRLIIENAYGQALLVVQLHQSVGHDAVMIHFETEAGEIYRMRVNHAPDTSGPVQTNPSPTPPPTLTVGRPALPERVRPQDWKCANPECGAMNEDGHAKCTWCLTDRPVPGQ
ncbi:hypothetical protein ACWC9H_35465 [Streptomyces sp. NPDC001251]